MNSRIVNVTQQYDGGGFTLTGINPAALRIRDITSTVEGGVEQVTGGPGIASTVKGHVQEVHGGTGGGWYYRRIGDRIDWYRPDQSRDDKGKFADEGKGSLGPGYVHPSEEPGEAESEPTSEPTLKAKLDKLNEQLGETTDPAEKEALLNKIEKVSKGQGLGRHSDVKESLVSRDVSSDSGDKAGNQHCNGIHFVTLSDGTRAILKPVSEEDDGLRVDFPGASFGDRDAAVYDVAEIVGMDDLVMPTVVRNKAGKYGRSSLQQLAPNGVVASKASDRYDGDEDMARSIAFDYLTGQTDRHANNWWILDNGDIRLIDSGMAFPGVDNGRSFRQQMLYEATNRGLEIPPEAKEWEKQWPDIKSALLQHGLEDEEIERTHRRVQRLATMKTFEDLEQHADADVNRTGSPVLARKPLPRMQKVGEAVRIVPEGDAHEGQVGKVVGRTLDNKGARVQLPDGRELVYDDSELTATSAESIGGTATGAPTEAEKMIGHIARVEAGDLAGKEVHVIGQTKDHYVVRLPDLSEHAVAKEDVVGLSSGGKQGNLPLDYNAGALESGLIKNDEVVDEKGYIHKKKDIGMPVNRKWEEMPPSMQDALRKIMADERKRKGQG